VCQQSLHVALQLNWILTAALEDYQPETPDGKPNKKSNPVYFSRCVKLLQNVERIVALGSPGADVLESLYMQGQLSGPQREAHLIENRKKQAAHVITSPSKHYRHLHSKALEGCLWHKRWVNRFVCGTATAIKAVYIIMVAYHMQLC
jgi:hypothetical protein